MKEFIQKRGFNYRKFFLKNDKIIVETKTIRKIDKFEVRLDRIGYDIYYQRDNVGVGKVMFWITSIAPFGFLIGSFYDKSLLPAQIILMFVICWTLSSLNYFKQHQDDIYLMGGQKNLVFYRETPNEESVLEFINEVINSSKLLLKEKYAIVDLSLSEEEFMGRLSWLIEKEVITNAEKVSLLQDFKIRKLL